MSLCRLPKTRSFDNLTTACDSSVPTTNRRSSDPSLNEKWQEHRRSLELSSLGPPGDDPFEGDGLGRQGRAPVGAELSVAAGVAEGQMENILQEATKDDVGLEEHLRGGLEAAGKGDEFGLDKKRADNLCGEKAEVDTGIVTNNPTPTPHPASRGASELKGQQDEHSDPSSALQKAPQGRGVQAVPSEGSGNRDAPNNTEEEGVGKGEGEAESPYGTAQAGLAFPLTALPEARISNIESSTETLTETEAKPELTPDRKSVV